MQNVLKDLSTFFVLLFIEKTETIPDKKESRTDSFKSNPCLWYQNLHEYRDRTLREALYNKLVEMYDSKFTKDNIKDNGAI